MGRHDGHMVRIVVTRNETELPWTDGWAKGDEALMAFISAAMSDLNAPRFRPGKIVATPGALAALDGNQQNAIDLLRRHLLGDWGVRRAK